MRRQKSANHRGEESPRRRGQSQPSRRAIGSIFPPITRIKSESGARSLLADSSIGPKKRSPKANSSSSGGSSSRLFPLWYATRRECLRAADIAIAECFSRSCISMGIRSRKREKRVPARAKGTRGGYEGATRRHGGREGRGRRWWRRFRPFRAYVRPPGHLPLRSLDS